MRQNTKTISTSIAFPFEMLERLERVAQDLRVPKSQLVREALIKEFPELERKAELSRKAVQPPASSDIPKKATPARP